MNAERSDDFVSDAQLPLNAAGLACEWRREPIAPLLLAGPVSGVDAFRDWLPDRRILPT
jgi:hypothetical protein